MDVTMTLKVFLSYDFTIAKNSAEWFEKHITEIGEGCVQVETAREARSQNILQQVREKIKSSDVVFCILTKRLRDETDDSWLPSQWVLDEAVYASTLGKKVCGFREKDIDPNKLGLAFSPGLEIPAFDPNNLDDSSTDLVTYFRDHLLPEEQNRPFQTELAHKTVHVRRYGFATVTVRYHIQRVIDPERLQNFQHYIWRVKKALPAPEDMLKGEPYSISEPYLTGSLIKRDDSGELEGRQDLDLSGACAHHGGREISFDIDLSPFKLRPWSDFEYEISWGYPEAFYNDETLVNFEDFQFNSTGFRAGRNGLVRKAILEI
jgi:hypothetical protein